MLVVWLEPEPEEQGRREWAGLEVEPQDGEGRGGEGGGGHINSRQPKSPKEEQGTRGQGRAVTGTKTQVFLNSKRKSRSSRRGAVVNESD